MWSIYRLSVRFRGASHTHAVTRGHESGVRMFQVLHERQAFLFIGDEYGVDVLKDVGPSSILYPSIRRIAGEQVGTVEYAASSVHDEDPVLKMDFRRIIEETEGQLSVDQGFPFVTDDDTALITESRELLAEKGDVIMTILGYFF